MHLSRILRHESIHPTRALLAEALAMYIDAEPGAEKQFFMDILRAVWVSPKRISWTEDGDPALGPATKVEAEDMAVMRRVFDSIVNPETAKPNVESN